jgi:hypothetical protein
MAAGRETISLSFQADLGDLKKQLAQLDGITKKEAAQMVKDLNVGFKQAERAAAKAAKANKKQFAQMSASAKDVGTAIAGAAVAVGALTAHFVELSNELTNASAKSGVAVDTLAGLRLAAKSSGLEFATFSDALGAFPVKMIEAASGAGNAAIAFEKLGVAATDQNGTLRSSEDVLRDVLEALKEVESQEERAALAAYALGEAAGPAFLQSGAIENLDAYVALARDFGTDIGPQAAHSAAALTQSLAVLETVSLGEIQKLIASIGGTDGSLSDVVDAATFSVVALGSVFAGTLANISEAVGMVIDGPIRALAMAMQGEPLEALRIFKETANDTFIGLGKFATGVVVIEGAIEGMENAAERLKELQKAQAALTPTAAAPTAATTGPSPAAAGEAEPGSTEATDTAIRDLERLRAAQRKASEARLSERAQIELAYIRETAVIEAALDADADREELEAAMAVADAERLIALDELEKRLHAEKMERMKAEAEEAIRINRETTASTAAALDSLAGLAGTAATAMAESGTRGARKNALVLFQVQKALALATIPLRLAEGLMTAAAQPPPINAIQGATVAATAAAQGIAIASAKPPTFDRGGIINAGTGDQIAAAVLPGEAILSREAVSNIGPSGVDALNSGRGMGGPMVVQMVYRHRVFDEFVQDNIQAPTPLGSALRGDRVTGRRS